LSTRKKEEENLINKYLSQEHKIKDMAGIALKKHNAKGHIVSGIARRRTDRTG
jgi:hypothetical protein